MISKNKKYYVYAHIFPNEKYYVGITCNLKSRWSNNGAKYKGQPVYSAILEHGWDNIDHVVLKSDLSSDEAEYWEKEYIKLFDSVKNGYNVANGGMDGTYVEFLYNGRLVSSKDLADLAKYDDITSHDITTRIGHHGWDIEKALNKKKTNKQTLYEYKGKKYLLDDIMKFSKVEGLTKQGFLNRVCKHGWDVERALTQPKDKKEMPHGLGEKIYEYEGKYYNSYELCQISPLDNLKPQDITDRINRRGWSVEKAITKPKINRNPVFEYNGKMYNSKELAKIALNNGVLNISHHDITDRINRLGWSVEKAVTTQKQPKPIRS